METKRLLSLDSFRGFIIAAMILVNLLGIVGNFSFDDQRWTDTLLYLWLATMTLAGSIFLVDILQYRKVANFGIILGSNAIAIYVLADVLAKLFYELPIGGVSLNDHFFSLLTGAGVTPKIVSMAYGLIYVEINFIPTDILHKRNILIKL